MITLSDGTALRSVVRLMDRRAFIATVTLGLLAARLAAEAQSAGKTARVGWLALGPNAGPAAVFFDAFREGRIPLSFYPAGTWGPPEADALLAGDDTWRNP